MIIQTNVTANNVVTVSQNLTTLVNEANDTADRNTDNLQVITNVLTQTAALLTSTTLSVQEVEMVSNEHTIVYSYSIVNRLLRILLIYLTMFNSGLLMLFKLNLICKLLL